MKVLRFTTELNYGGIEKVLELHAKHHDESYELIFVALGKGGSTQKILESLGYNVIILNAAKVKIPSARLIKSLVEVLRKERPDVVHASGAEANFHVPIAAKVVGVRRVICEEIGIPSHSRKAKLIFRYIYKFSDKVIAISKAVEEYLLASKEVPVTKASLIYNPVNEDGIIDGCNREEFLFTVVARLEPVKNLPFLIEVFSKVLTKWPEVRLNIIGDGSQRKLLQEKIDGLKISDKVILKGFLPNPYTELAKSTFFILPSLFEGFGLACIEAIQAGNIVICTNSGGIPEFIKDGEQGFLFNPTDNKALMAAIDKAISLTPNKREEMISLAQEKTSLMFSPRKYINELKELYQGI